MPQDKLLETLISRPASTGATYKPQEIPWKDEDALTRFFGGLTGLDDEGGGVAGLIGAMMGTMSPVKGAKNLKSLYNAKTVPGSMAEFLPVGDEAVSRFAGALPQVDDAFQASGKYTPEVSSEMGRLMGEMLGNKGVEGKVKGAWQEFHKVNPEATGHVRELSINSDPNRSALGNMFLSPRGEHGYPLVPRNEREWAGTININPVAIGSKGHTTAHELQHQVQQMIEGRNQFGKNYWKMDEQLGWDKNPYEIEAENVAKDIMKKVKLSKLSGR